MKLTVPSSLDDITLIQYQEYNQEIESRKKLPDAEEYLKIKVLCQHLVIHFIIQLEMHSD